MMLPLRILLVEDELALRLVAKVALEKVGGYTVNTCASGKEALQVVREFKPDLFVLDVMMPHLDGPATLMQLREMPEFLETPAIFLTAKVQSREILELLAHGAIGVLQKPFDPMQLSQNVSELVRQHAKKRQR